MAEGLVAKPPSVMGSNLEVGMEFWVWETPFSRGGQVMPRVCRESCTLRVLGLRDGAGMTEGYKNVPKLMVAVIECEVALQRWPFLSSQGSKG